MSKEIGSAVSTEDPKRMEWSALTDDELDGVVGGVTKSDVIWAFTKAFLENNGQGWTCGEKLCIGPVTIIG